MNTPKPKVLIIVKNGEVESVSANIEGVEVVLADYYHGEPNDETPCGITIAEMEKRCAEFTEEHSLQDQEINTFATLKEIFPGIFAKATDEKGKLI